MNLFSFCEQVTHPLHRYLLLMFRNCSFQTDESIVCVLKHVSGLINCNSKDNNANPVVVGYSLEFFILIHKCTLYDAGTKMY